MYRTEARHKRMRKKRRQPAPGKNSRANQSRPEPTRANQRQPETGRADRRRQNRPEPSNLKGLKQGVLEQRVEQGFWEQGV